MRIMIFFIGVFLVACQTQDDPASKLADTEHSIAAKATEFITLVEDLRLRDGPGEKAAIITTLERGTLLTDAGEVSDYTSKVTLRGIRYDEPWIKVKTTKGVEGWVYAGGLEIKAYGDGKLVNALVQKKSISIFGASLTRQMNQYHHQFQQIKTEQDVAAVLSTGISLQEALSQKLLTYATPGPNAEFMDIRWLPRVFPGFVPNLVAEGTRYQVFLDYRDWGKIARKTNGIQDDLYLDVQYLIHPQDSMEYVYPAWIMETSAVDRYHLLGSGIQAQVLDKINAQYDTQNPFKELLMTIKKAVISDIIDADAVYWLPLKEVTRELDAILAKDYRIISKEERVAMETRRKQLDQPEVFQIISNVRAGE
jgi:hypothetical protein